MNTQVSFRQMETSPALRDYATGKLERIVDKYVHGRIDASVVMSVQKYWHIADFTLNIKNLTVKGQERSEDMYSSIDLALDKIEKQLRRHKDRLRDHKPSNGQSRTFKMGIVSSLEPRTVQEELEHEFPEDFDMYPAPEEEPKKEEEGVAVARDADGNEVNVLRSKELSARAMTLEEAVIQLDLLEDREFFVFTNPETEAINIVFKRRDGNVGLIES